MFSMHLKSQIKHKEMDLKRTTHHIAQNLHTLTIIRTCTVTLY